jgi:hypothetical protein
LEKLPFVRRLHYIPLAGKDRGYDGELHITTSAGQFRLPVAIKRSFLTQSAISQLLAWLEHRANRQPERAILLARYIPRPVADQLLDAKVNFADDAGNVHLEWGGRYNWTVIGKPAPQAASESRTVTPAQVQLLFQFAANPESISWPVRRLESTAGISKSSVATVRQQLLDEGLLVRKGRGYRIGPAHLLRDRLVSGYAQVLRPKLSCGRFRSADKDGEQFLTRLHERLSPGFRYALTGAPAAFLLQKFYRSPDIPIFAQPVDPTVLQRLRLLPDRQGPITLLRAFGEVVFWEEREHRLLAPPWLIYAELCAGADPRAHEAAEDFYSKRLA